MEIRDVPTIERISIHSHINGLGENNDEIEYNKDGLVAQIEARKAMLFIKKMIEKNKSGRLVLIKGPSGSGKTALGLALSKSLGNDVIFNNINATEIYSLELSKSESLTQAIRKSIGLKIKETVKVIEGEVFTISTSKIGLKTMDMESSFDIGKNMREQIEKEKVTVGDIIRIIKDKGKIIKLGASSAKSNPGLLGDIKFVACPEGELLKLKEEIQYVSLHDIDVINNRTQGYLALFTGENGEIKSEVREEVNNKVKKWILEGKAEIKRGVLFIDEVHMLDIESFSFLNKSLEDSYCPVIIMATNKSECIIRGTNKLSPFGMPMDLINRTLIISTSNYQNEDFLNIFKLRIEEEDIKITDEALGFLVEVANKCGLRYSFNVLTISDIRRKKRNAGFVTIDDLKRICNIFLDEKRGLESFE